jgi:hypothetical protein
MPCPPPDGLDEVTACETPRALTPAPGAAATSKKRRSGEYALDLPPTLDPAADLGLLHDRCHTDPPGARAAKAHRETAAELCHRLGYDEPTEEQRRRNLEDNVDSWITKPLPGIPPKLPPGAGRER